MNEAIRTDSELIVSVESPTNPTRVESAHELGKVAAYHIEGKRYEALQELREYLSRHPDSSEAQYIQARLQMEENDYAPAVRSWEAYHALANGNIDTHRSMAECYQQAEDWSSAAETFMLVLAASPEDDESSLGYCLCQLHLQRPEEAVQGLNKYLERRQEDPVARFGLAVGYQMLLRLDEAVAIYQDLLSEGHYTQEALTNLVTIYRQQKNADRLLETCKRVLLFAPESPSALEGAAFAEFLQGNYNEAAGWSERLSNIEPERYERWMNLGLCRWKQGDLEAALAAFRQVVRLRPDVTEAHSQIVAILLDLGRNQDALSTAARAVDACPDSDDLYILLGATLEKEGQADKAEMAYQGLVECKPSNSEGWFRLGNLRHARGDFEGSVKAFENCLRLKQDWPEAQLNSALANFECGRLNQASATLDSVLATKPDWEPAIRAAAVTALKLGDLKRALEYHDRLISIGCGEAEVYYNAALLLEQSGKLENALDYYRKSLQVRPDFAEALVNLGHVLQGLGQANEAKQQWARALKIKPSLAGTYFGVPG